MDNYQKPHTSLNFATAIMEPSIHAQKDPMFGICGAVALAGLVSALIAIDKASIDQIQMVILAERDSQIRKDCLADLYSVLKDDDAKLQAFIDQNAHPDILRIIANYLGIDKTWDSKLTPHAWFEVRLNVGMNVDKAAA